MFILQVKPRNPDTVPAMMLEPGQVFKYGQCYHIAGARSTTGTLQVYSLTNHGIITFRGDELVVPMKRATISIEE